MQHIRLDGVCCTLSPTVHFSNLFQCGTIAQKGVTASLPASSSFFLRSLGRRETFLPSRWDQLAFTPWFRPTPMPMLYLILIFDCLSKTECKIFSQIPKLGPQPINPPPPQYNPSPKRPLESLPAHQDFRIPTNVYGSFWGVCGSCSFKIPYEWW